ncbi:MAG: twin-arginine translocase TatA/TatE family subunit [Chitinophagales bacterium]
MFGLIGNLGPWELGLVLVIILIIFGPGKLPGVGKSIGKALGEFRKARSGEDEEKTNPPLEQSNKAE